MMQRTKINGSQNIQSFGYDPEAKTLHVEFRGADVDQPGRVYEYTGIDPEIVADFESADSKGGYFHRFIRQQFTGRRLTQKELKERKH